MLELFPRHLSPHREQPRPGEIIDLGRGTGESRVKAGLTQEQQAELLGFTLKYLQRIEGGGENLTVRSLAKITSAFGVPVTELFRKPQTKQARPGRPRRRGRTREGEPG